MNFLNTKYARVLTAVLLVQGTAFYATALRDEDVPVVRPLASFPAEVSGWHIQQDVKIEQEVLDILKADDTLNRVYINPAGNAAGYLFIAFFKTQRYGQTPHSPKNCLPGSGWEPLESEPIRIDIAGRAEPIVSNRYVVARGEEKSVVLYWYQSRNRIIASEYSAKFWLIVDSIRYHRSDSSLVKIVVPVSNGDTAAATRVAIEFAQAMFPAISRQLPV
jgi:EpsI family protein